MKNIPKEIYLNLGLDSDEIEKDDDFEDFEGVSWCENQISSGDIKYILADQYSTPQDVRGRYVSDELIENYSTVHAMSENVYSEREYSLIKDALIWMRNQIFTSPPEMEREWISVDDRLPEHGQRCIVVQNPKTTATRHSLYAEYDAVRKRFTNVCSTIDGIHLLLTSWADIIFWQPLPSPPRSVGDKKEEV